jgi:3'-phosphoadenosine 5'-phosphosulfate sulfotransferase (PAPS reductase)/FAD synthetase
MQNWEHLMAYKYIEQEAPHFLSLGAGVQSSTMALMAAYGEITPLPKVAIFSDTQVEPPDVYSWLNYLEDEIKKAPYPFPVHRVTHGNLEDEIFKIRIIKTENRKFPIGTQYLRTTIP